MEKAFRKDQKKVEPSPAPASDDAARDLAAQEGARRLLQAQIGAYATPAAPARRWEPPYELQTRIPGDAAVADVDTTTLHEKVMSLGWLDEMRRDQDWIGWPTIEHATSYTFWKAHLKNGRLHQPLRWASKDYTVEGALVLTAKVAQVIYEGDDGVQVSDSATSGVTAGTGAQAGTSTTVGGKAGISGVPSGTGTAGAEVNAGATQSDGVSESQAVTATSTSSTSPTQGVRFRVILDWDGKLDLTVTPRSSMETLMPIPASALATRVTQDFHTVSQAVVRVPAARCRPAP